MSEWREVTLGDVLALQRGFDLPARDRVDGPYPIVSSSGVTGRHAVAKVGTRLEQVARLLEKHPRAVAVAGVVM